MPNRKITKRNKDGKITSLKKYSGISEFYSATDHDKKTLYHYIQYPDIDPKEAYHKEKVLTLDRDEALTIRNQKRNFILQERRKIKNGELRLEDAKLRGELTLDEMTKLWQEEYGDITAKSRYDNHITTAILDDSSPEKLGEMKVKNITTAHIKKLQKLLQKKINSRTKKFYSNRTIDEIIFVLRSIFYAGIEEGWCKDNPVIHKKIERIANNTDNEPGRILNKHELKKLWKLDDLVNNHRLYLFTIICYYTGARPDAVIDIQVKN